MSQSRDDCWRQIIIVVSIILGLFSLILFCKAVFTVNPPTEVPMLPKIQIYLNGDDSVVVRLQQNVQQLNELIEKMDPDTIILERRKPVMRSDSYRIVNDTPNRKTNKDSC